MDCWYFEIPQDVEIIVLIDCIWLMFVPSLFIKSTLFADFPMNLLPNPVVSTLIFLICHLTALAQNMIDILVNMTTHFTFEFLSGLFYLCLDQIGSDCLLLSYHYQCFCFSFKVPSFTYSNCCSSARFSVCLMNFPCNIIAFQLFCSSCFFCFLNSFSLLVLLLLCIIIIMYY